MKIAETSRVPVFLGISNLGLSPRSGCVHVGGDDDGNLIIMKVKMVSDVNGDDDDEGWEE